MSVQKIIEKVNPAECLQQMVTAYTDYLKVAEQEQTKQREIKAWEKETITRINAQRELLMAYLDRSFDERAENFRALFSVVIEQLALALNSITEYS
ncbi:hypothetical protein [Fischerella thermalis]|uniref:hypothetical protein n=1 Tax=Fischerella thermalis TaxID=372787 RepID=UPI00215578E8|nr:hypothetical protein [Fischerella thermalis]